MDQRSAAQEPCGIHESRSLGLLAAGFILFGLPDAAHAHTAVKGLGDFGNGLIHPLITPSHVLVILGLGLWLGQHPPLNLKTPMKVFAPLSAAALLLTATGWITTIYQPALIALAMCAGTLVALERPLPPTAGRALLGIAAIALGLDSAIESDSTASVVKALLGTWISLVFLVCDLAFYVSLCTQKRWLKVGIRVLGSWIIAISLLVLAFAFKK